MKNIFFILAFFMFNFCGLSQNVGRVTSTGLRLGSQVAPTEMLDITGKQILSNTFTGVSTTVYGASFSSLITEAANQTGTLVGLRGHSQWSTSSSPLRTLTKAIGVLGSFNSSPASVNGTTTNAYCFAANTTHTEGQVTTLSLYGVNSIGSIISGSIGTMVGLDLPSLVGTTKMSLRSTDATATMRHAGNVILGETSVPESKLDIVQPTVGSSILRLSSSTAITFNPNLNFTQAEIATTTTVTTTMQTIPTTFNANTFITAEVIGHSESGDLAGTYILRGTYRNVAGTAILVGAVQQDYVAEDVGANTWNATLTISGGNVLVQVTGTAVYIAWNTNTKVSYIQTIAP